MERDRSWAKEGKRRSSPYAFELASGQTFRLCGPLWDAWKDSAGHWLRSFAIVTAQANEIMSRIHPRTPVILHARDYDRWLDREETERLLLDLLRPYSPKRWKSMRPVRLLVRPEQRSRDDEGRGEGG